MIQRRHRARAALYMAADLGATLVAFFIAWNLRFENPVVPIKHGVPEFQRYLELLPAVLLIWPIVFYFHGLYQTRRGRSRVDEVLTVVVAILLAAILLSTFSAYYRPPLEPGSALYFTYSRWFLGLFVGLDLLLVATARMTVRWVLQRRALNGHSQQRILVVGAGMLGREIAKKLQDHRELGLQLVGFLDDDPGKAGASFHGAPVLGAIQDVDRVLEEDRVDQVYIALPLEAHKKMLRALERVRSECVEVKLVPDILQYATLKATLEDLDGTPVINLSQVPLQGWTSLVKRGMDAAVAATGLLALTFVVPVLPLIALAIWLEDRGPVLYRQERMGLDGRPFMIWKFRSMRSDAEGTTGPVWAIRNDERRTRLGSLLRRWSLDELPQLWNVLRGDMSLVGPRPERPTFVREFKHKVPQYMLRHRVKAGITGWAQVHGWRGNTSIRKRIQYDLYYIENWSLKLDLKILWMTLRQGLRHHNAY
ncbi:MAG TPA: undecaprenyl-phosphate glucose phosphotransferase [Thermoanaerobaculia bacterium]|nr:undecaprenyl-phosphate glucose phosphotransferase [Thermoanaerobaculia bacterium]